MLRRPLSAVCDDQQEDIALISINSFDIISSPNDFNILTLFSMIEKGKIYIPTFQRHHVWDVKKSSKLIESLLIGLPVPQIFLYERGGRYSVIDGQQRLFTIYYFVKNRFPRMNKRSELKAIFDEHAKIPDPILSDNSYFSDFNLSLPLVGEKENPLNKKNYQTIASLLNHKNESLRDAFDYGTIRCVILKQSHPSSDESSIFEIFGRLNSGGVNLTDQEIRVSLYHSEFIELLIRLNKNENWRSFFRINSPDIHMKDIEIMMRGFACFKKTYSSPMKRFLNDFSSIARDYSSDDLQNLERIFVGFCGALSGYGPSLFEISEGRFSVPLFESVFGAFATKFEHDEIKYPQINESLYRIVCSIKNDDSFNDLLRGKTTNKSNYDKRKEICLNYIKNSQ